jgi:RNA polymerase sigma factor (sigma-70 family)
MGLFSRTSTPRAPSRAAVRPANLTELYAEHFAGVLGSIRFFGVPERDAQDVAQDVFVRVQASLPAYDPARSVGPWLKTIAYRTAQDYLRSAHSRRMRLAPTEEDMEITDTAPSPERRTLLAEMQRVLIEVLQEISEDQRTVYLMNVKDEISVSEIAELLGWPENTVRSRLHRAHQAIDAAVTRRRTAEEQRNPAMVPLLVPTALANAARTGFEIDPAVQAAVWSKLSRLLGLGIIGALAPLPGGAIAAVAAALLALGGGAGALLHARLARPAAPETVMVAERAAPAGGSASPGGPPDATADASTTQATIATVSASASGVGPDAGAPDAAAQLRAEQALLGRARSAMDGERYETALRELNRHEVIYPSGKLAQQRKDMKRVVMAELSGHDGGR